VPEFTGWRAWLVRHLPWYDEPITEAKHAHDARLRRDSTAKMDRMVEDFRLADRTIRRHR